MELTILTLKGSRHRGGGGVETLSSSPRPISKLTVGQVSRPLEPPFPLWMMER